MRNFEVIEGDIDYNVSTRIIKGRLTKRRYKAIARYCRIHSGRVPYCGCEHDCCGHVTSRWMTPYFSQGEAYITYVINYNY